MLVNLFTPGRDLEDLMLSEYPEKIFGDQIAELNLEDGSKLYVFFKLDYKELVKFLTQYPDYEFRILEHPTGRFIEDYRNFNNPHFYH